MIIAILFTIKKLEKTQESFHKGMDKSIVEYSTILVEYHLATQKNQ